MLLVVVLVVVAVVNVEIELECPLVVVVVVDGEALKRFILCHSLGPTQVPVSALRLISSRNRT